MKIYDMEVQNSKLKTDNNSNKKMLNDLSE